MNQYGSTSQTMPRQDLPMSKKGKHWIAGNMDFLYQQAIQQQRRNQVFTELRKMSKGQFVYRSVDVERSIQDNPTLQGQYNYLTKDKYVSTHLKNFDFIGIILNAITGAYGNLDDKYRTESIDEYTENEYIRAMTVKHKEYAQAILKAEIDRMLIAEGFNPDQTDFKSEEEKQAYMQELDARVQSLTPAEVTKNLSKNFKLLAEEWATNTLKADKKRFSLRKMDTEQLTDMILTGRYFRHFPVGYDKYGVERWLPEQVSFSENLDCAYPQNLDYISHLTKMSRSTILTRYGHLMTTKQQSAVANYWGQEEVYNIGGTGSSESKSVKNSLFGGTYQVPFNNWFDHQANLQMEDALGVPLAQSMDENGEISRHWMPRFDGTRQAGFGGNNGFYRNLRDDINFTNDSIEVMESYFRSMKLMGVLVIQNDLGNAEVHEVSEELLPEYLEEREIKKVTNVSLETLRKAAQEEDLTEHINTVSYHWIPEIWHGIKIRGNSTTVKKDLDLDVRPLDYQVKGDSNIYDVMIPVGGIITDSQMPKVLPFQQLHNVCMNHVTELLRDEIGTFYSIDVNSLAGEYKGETTEESLFNALDIIKAAKLLPLDPSRSNTEGSTVYPNLFQRNEVLFTNQMQSRREFAEYYRQSAYNLFGITPQMLGAPSIYQTAEGVKSGAQAIINLMSGMFEDFDLAKAKGNELHVAVAQFCECNGKESSRLFRRGDTEIQFIDILAEDGETFPLRKISVLPPSDSRDRTIVQAIQNLIVSDNTIPKDIGDAIDVLSNPDIQELKYIGIEVRKRADAKLKQDQQFQAEQNDKIIKAKEKEIADERIFKKELEAMKIEAQYGNKYIESLGRDANSTKENDMDALTKAYNTVKSQGIAEQTLNIKTQELERKVNVDKSKQDLELRKIAQVDRGQDLKDKEIASKERIATINPG